MVTAIKWMVMGGPQVNQTANLVFFPLEQNF